jgi:hypothetical protein
MARKLDFELILALVWLILGRIVLEIYTTYVLGLSR